MSLTALTLPRTFGVEVEVLGPPDIATHLATALGATRCAYVNQDEGELQTPYGQWKDVRETSLTPTEEHPATRELVSPVFNFGSSADRGKVAGVVRALQHDFAVNDSCGLHVHVGVGNRAQDPELILSGLARSFEWGRVIHALLLDKRYQSHFCEVHTSWYMAYYAAFFTGKTPLTYQRIMRRVLGADPRTVSKEDKLEIARNYGVNLSALALHGTIEYRFFEGTLDPDLVLACVELCVRFTALIMSSPAVLHPTREPSAANLRDLFDVLELSPQARALLWTAEVTEHLRSLARRRRTILPTLDLSLLDLESRRLSEELMVCV